MNNKLLGLAVLNAFAFGNTNIWPDAKEADVDPESRANEEKEVGEHTDIIMHARNNSLVWEALGKAVAEIYNIQSTNSVTKGYDGPPKTDDDPQHIAELMSLVGTLRIHRLATRLFERCISDATTRHSLEQEFVTALTSEVRSVLGHKRPLHENDAEYFALCDAIADKAARRIAFAFYKGNE